MSSVFTRLSLKVFISVTPSSGQALVQAGLEQILGQIDTDEHHLADLGFAGRPFGAYIAAHQLVHALENHFFVHAGDVQHPLVAQHARAVDLDHGAQEIFQLGGVEGAGSLVDEGLDVIVVGMVVRVVAVLAMLMIVVMMVVIVPVVVILQEVGVDVELGIEVETLDVKDFLERHFTEMHALLWCARVHVLDAVGEEVFTSVPTSSHGTSHGRLSNVEQVLGRSDAVQVQILVTQEEMNQLLERLREEFRGTGLRYWASALAAEGEIE